MDGGRGDPEKVNLGRRYAQWLESEMALRDWKAARLAERSGVTPQAISTILGGGRRNPTVGQVAALARALRMTPNDVFEALGIWDSDEAERDRLPAAFASVIGELHASAQELALHVLRGMANNENLRADGRAVLTFDHQGKGEAANPKVRALPSRPPQDAVPEVDSKGATEEDGDTDQYDPKNPAHAAVPESEEFFEAYQRTQEVDGSHDEDRP